MSYPKAYLNVGSTDRKLQELLNQVENLACEAGDKGYRELEVKLRLVIQTSQGVSQ